jgi:hypothetical protein
MRSILKHAVTRSLFAAGALTATAALAPSTVAAEQVAVGLGTRSPDAIERGIGRAGGDPYWVSQPLAPVPEPLVKAYDKTKEVVVKGYDKTRDVLTTPPTSTGPERYGRAGGYVGLEKLQVQSNQTYASDSPGTPPSN